MYPQRNPFPAQATTIIEGSPLGEIDQLTLARPAVSRLSDLVSRYRASYDAAADDNGKTIAVHGEHGSGKTHALAHAMVSLSSAEEEPPVRVLYVRADSPDVLSLYRKLMSQLSLQDLQDLCRQARQQYAREELAASRGLDERALDAALESTDADADGDWVARAFRSAELQPTAVLDRQMSDLARQGLRQKDFERVVPNLLNRDLDESAYRWLRGEQLPDPELRALGITENIDDSLKVRTGIQTLLILSRRAGQRIALFLDQAEALVTSGPGALDLDNVGTLRAILEGVAGNGGLLVVAIRESVWRLLPSDLRQRFGPSEIQTTSLTEPEAADLVALFVAPWTSEGDPRTYPLDALGLREALVSSGGNIRRFIQLCSLLFTVAAPAERLIDRSFAHRVLSSEASPVPTRGAVSRQLTALLVAAHVPYQAEYLLPGGLWVDFAVENEGGSFRAFIVVTDALVGLPELSVANRTLGLVQRAAGQARPAEIILIVGGYLSPELTAELSKVHRVIVVTGETGQRDLDALVSDLRTDSPPATGTEAELRAQLDEVLARLEAQQEDREREQRILWQQIEALGRAQGGRRESDEVAETGRQWRTAEEELRAQIRTARVKRQEAELSELELLRAKSERDGRRAAVEVGVGCFLTAAAMFVVAGLQSNALASAILFELSIVLALAACLAPLAFLWRQRRREGNLGKRAASIQQLDSLAYGYLLSGEAAAALPLPAADDPSGPASEASGSPASHVTRTLIRSRNPQVTYAIGLAKLKFGRTDLTRVLAGQQSAIVRRSLVRKLAGDYDLPGFEAVLDTIGSDPAASAAFDMFHALPMSSPQYSKMLLSPLHRRPLQAAISSRLSAELLMVARLYGYSPSQEKAPRTLGILGGFLLPDLPDSQDADQPLSEAGHGERREQVTKLRLAYEDGGDASLTGVLRAFTERELRTAAFGLSPFDAGRPGTFDWLDRIGDIDEMYLFFRKCLFYQARGTPVPSVEI